MNQANIQKKNPEVDEFLQNSKKWQKELMKLRSIVMGCSLSEELKWGKPCYTYEKKNIVILQGFKEFCAILFPKGALLSDAKGILEKPGPNTRAARRIPFSNIIEITRLEKILKSYVCQAIEVEKAGLNVDFAKAEEYILPEELQVRFYKDPKLKDAFDALTPGRQRAYILYFSAAKQSKTRQARVEKCVQRILAVKGLNDPYEA